MFLPLPEAVFLGAGALALMLSVAFLLLHIKRIHYYLQRHRLMSEAVPGGYYYWDALHGEEEVSPGMQSLFLLPPHHKSLEDICVTLGNEANVLRQMVDELKEGSEQVGMVHVHPVIAGESRHFQCIGHRLERKGRMAGLLLWCFDLSECMATFHDALLENERLKEEMRSYNNLLNTVPFPLWQRDRELNICYYNLAYGKYIDEPGRQLPESEISEIARGIKALARAAQQTAVMKAERRHLILEGQRRLFSITEVPAPQGSKTVGFAYDISQQENIEKELLRHISAHGDLLESSSSAMAIYGADTKIRFYNNAFVKLWDIDEKWLAATPTYAEVLDRLREERKLPEQVDFRNFKREQLERFTTLLEPYNEFFYLPDGKVLRVIVIPHALGGLLFAYEDMTDRIAMERSYNTLIAVQKATLDNLNEGVAVFAEDGKLRLYNPKYVEIWNADIKFLEKRPHISELLDRSRSLFNMDAKKWKQFRDTVISETTGRTPFYYRHELVSGKVIDRAAVPLPDGGMLVSFVDVTDTTLLERSLRERNEALEEADRIKTKFLANISYELRTPLTSIRGFSEALKDGFVGKLQSQQKEYIQSIYDSSLQLSSLIDDVLDLASMEAGYLSLDTVKFDVAKMLVGVVEKLRQHKGAGSASVYMRGVKKAVTMLGDEKHLRQAVMHLLNNALKFTDGDGRITVTLEKQGKKMLSIQVKDNGIGIPKEELPKVFDHFYKTEAAWEKQGAGAGLGLSVVKNIIEMHGGTVEIESAKGKGTTVTCILPQENMALKKINQNLTKKKTA